MASATVGILRALLTANTADFESAMTRAEAKTLAASRTLARFGSDFSGQRLFNEAEKAVSAVEKIGGVSKLTQGELTRLSSTLDAATAKFKTMGVEIPPHIQLMSTELRQLTQQAEIAASPRGIGALSGAMSLLRAAFPAATIAGAITGIVAFGKRSFDAAGEVADLADKTGLSTETIQRMRAVAQQTGTSVETFSNAVFRLGVNLENASTRTKSAVRDLGLSFDVLKNKSPEQQFDAIVRALQRQDNETKRNAIGVALFGRQFGEIAASIKANYTDIADAAKVSSNEQIRALDAAGDAWQKFKNDVSASVTSVLGTIVGLVRDPAFMGSLEAGPEVLRKEIERLLAKGKDVNALVDMLNKSRKDLALPLVGEKDPRLSGAVSGLEDYVKALSAAKSEVSALSQAQRTQLNAALKLGGDAAREYAGAIGLSDAALHLYQASLKGGTKETDAFTKAQDALFGRDLIARANDFAKQLGDVSNITKLSTDKKKELHTAVVAAIDAYQRLGLTAPQVLRDIEAATRPLLVSTRQWATVELKAAIDNTTVFESSVRSLGIEAVPLLSASIHQSRLGFVGLKEAVQDNRLGMDAMGKSAKSLGMTLKESLLGVLENIPSLIQQAFTGGGGLKGAAEAIVSQLGADLGRSLGQMFGGKIGGQIGAGLGSLIGKAFTSDKTWVRAIAGFAVGGPIGATIAALVNPVSAAVKKARAEVQAFQDDLAKTATSTQKAEAAGRPWALTVIRVRDAFRALGRSAAEAEELVGRMWDTDNPERARAAIEEIQRALDAVAERTEAASGIFDDLMEAAERAGGQIPESLRPAIEQLISMGLLTDDQAAKLRALGTGTGPSLKQMEDALATINGRMESLGPTFRQAKINETAAKYINAIDTLIRGASDVGGVLFDAREELSALVRDALRLGTTLPAQLKPWIEELARSGNLVDENGEKIEDISDLKFGEPIKTEAEIAAEGFQKIIDKIEELIGKITDGLGGAIRNIPSPRLPSIGEGPGERPDGGGREPIDQGLAALTAIGQLASGSGQVQGANLGGGMLSASQFAAAFASKLPRIDIGPMPDLPRFETPGEIIGRIDHKFPSDRPRDVREIHNHPMGFFVGQDRNELIQAAQQHMAERGIGANEFGLRDVIESVAEGVTVRVLNKAGVF